MTRRIWWPDRCLVCRAELSQPARGRPRRYCDNPDCRRKLAAERQARRRRRLQGLGERMPRQPGGGRRSLLERAAASWAAKYLPDLELTAEELEMVGEFLRDYPYGSPYAFRNRRPAGCELSRETWLKLRDLVQRQADEPRRRVAGETARREGERRRVALAEHPDGEYLGGGLVRLRDGYVARSSASASNYELRCAIVGADGAAVKALVAQGRSLASLTSGDGLRDEFEADERRRENLDALAAMADELRREEGARMAAAGSGERSQGRPTSR